MHLRFIENPYLKVVAILVSPFIVSEATEESAVSNGQYGKFHFNSKAFLKEQ